MELQKEYHNFLKKIINDVVKNNQINDLNYIISNSVLNEIEEELSKRDDSGLEFCKNIYSLDHEIFENILNENTNSLINESQCIVIYYNLFYFVDKLINKNNFNINNINQIYLNAALKAASKNGSSSDYSEIKGFENTTNPNYANLLYF